MRPNGTMADLKGGVVSGSGSGQVCMSEQAVTPDIVHVVAAVAAMHSGHASMPAGSAASSKSTHNKTTTPERYVYTTHSAAPSPAPVRTSCPAPYPSHGCSWRFASSGPDSKRDTDGWPEHLSNCGYYAASWQGSTSSPNPPRRPRPRRLRRPHGHRRPRTIHRRAWGRSF